MSVWANAAKVVFFLICVLLSCFSYFVKGKSQLTYFFVLYMICAPISIPTVAMVQYMAKFIPGFKEGVEPLSGFLTFAPIIFMGYVQWFVVLPRIWKFFFKKRDS